jgi:hypothetical protein
LDSCQKAARADKLVSALPSVSARLRPGTLIVADNTDDSPGTRAIAREWQSAKPLAEDVELSMRIR